MSYVWKAIRKSRFEVFFIPNLEVDAPWVIQDMNNHSVDIARYHDIGDANITADRLDHMGREFKDACT